MFYLIVKRNTFILFIIILQNTPYHNLKIVVVYENNYYYNFMYNVHVSSELGDPESLLYSRVSPLLFMFMADYSCQHFAISEMVLIISIHKKGDECLAPLKSYSSTTNFVEIQRVSFERKKRVKDYTIYYSFHLLAVIKLR